MVKNSPANAGDTRDVVSIPRSGRSPGGGNDSPLQFSCLENPMDRRIHQSKVHEVSESDMVELLNTHTGTIPTKKPPSLSSKILPPP